MLCKFGQRWFAVFASLSTLLVCGRAVAHPGHSEALASPLPVWRLADGAAMTAYLLKVQDGRAWFVDAAHRVIILPPTALDEAGQQAVNRTVDRSRTLNGGSSRSPNAVAAMGFAFTGLLADSTAPMPEMARVFAQFERVKTHWDTRYLYVESNGLPDHPMMKGITAWQQQVPLPQPYTGDNAWRIPLVPVVSKSPVSIKGRFLRGAIALAANGIPIFNPQNNRGEVSAEIGELDEWGGHCGRADDYHYHAAPLHLQTIVGKGKPIAYALDGYPIYGLAEPDGAVPAGLDAFNGHVTPALGYHYHASRKYPFINGGFHGEMTEAGGQVDPQPRANPVRPDTRPLRGATITDFKATGNCYELTYDVGGRKGSVRYTLNSNGSYTFTFEDPQGQKTEQTFERHDTQGGPPSDNQRNSGREQNRSSTDVAPAGHAPAPVKGDSSFSLRSSVVTDGSPLPVEFTGDGAGATPPLEWSNPPAGTQSFAVVMHHIPGPGDVKWYWVLYNIPASTRSLPKNVKDVGTLGTNSVNGRTMYAPPHSKGPGAKTYILTVYALSAAPQFNVAAERVDRAALLAAIKDRTLASAELKVTYDRTGVINGGEVAQPAREPNADDRPTANGPLGGVVHLMPREVEAALKLTPDQQRQVADLEQETVEKINKLLTAEQAKTLSEIRPPPRPGQREPAPPRD